MADTTRKVLLRRGALAASIGADNPQDVAPPKNNTVTLWDSRANYTAKGYSGYGLPPKACDLRRIIVNAYSSHANVNILIKEGIDGTNWRNLQTYAVAATTLRRVSFEPSMPHLIVQMQETANATVTTWDVSVVGDFLSNDAGV